jgi:hypothetical protein
LEHRIENSLIEDVSKTIGGFDGKQLRRHALVSMMQVVIRKTSEYQKFNIENQGMSES